MVRSAVIKTYFPTISDYQEQQFNQLSELYLAQNQLVNLISRKDIDYLYLKHVLHSLAIAKYISFVKGTKILDFGTGGGFPGIPLAILFPESNFYLLDSITKKIKAVSFISESLKLNNVTLINKTASKLTDMKFDFVISRAVTSVFKTLNFFDNAFLKANKNSLPNGYLLLKGGDLNQEMKEARVKEYSIKRIIEWFKYDFFETKKLIYIPVVKQ